MVAVFCGQLIGTAVGNHVYALGGWKAAGGTSMGFIGAAVCVVFVRGPWERGWAGWRGGWGLKGKKSVGDVEAGCVDEGVERVSSGEVSREEVNDLNLRNEKEIPVGRESDERKVFSTFVT